MKSRCLFIIVTILFLGNVSCAEKDSPEVAATRMAKALLELNFEAMQNACAPESLEATGMIWEQLIKHIGNIENTREYNKNTEIRILNTISDSINETQV